MQSRYVHAARRLAFGLGVFLLGAGNAALGWQEAANSQQRAAAVAAAGHDMAHAATNLWNALTPEQQAKAGFSFDDPYRYDWHFIPRERKGLPLKEMTPEQERLAHSLLASGMGMKGFVKAETIMSLEAVLRDIEKGSGPVRDPELYFFCIFGNPNAPDHHEPWGWRVEGHHLSVNFTIAGHEGSVGGPTFFGANPGEVRAGPRKGLRVLAAEEDVARALVKSLNDEQRKVAIVSEEAPKDILSAALRKATPLEPAGLSAGKLSGEQVSELLRLMTLYAERLRPELASEDLAKAMRAGVDKIHFAWAGGTEPGQPHYYRIQGPTFLIEYDNTQNNANHIHSVWRDYTNDFGDDLLKRHYEQHPHVNGEHKN